MPWSFTKKQMPKLTGDAEAFENQQSHVKISRAKVWNVNQLKYRRQSMDPGYLDFSKYRADNMSMVTELENLKERHLYQIWKVTKIYTMKEATALIDKAVWAQLKKDGHGPQSSCKILAGDWEMLSMASEEEVKTLQKMQITKDDRTKYAWTKPFNLQSLGQPAPKVHETPGMENARRKSNKGKSLGKRLAKVKVKHNEDMGGFDHLCAQHIRMLGSHCGLRTKGPGIDEVIIDLPI